MRHRIVIALLVTALATAVALGCGWSAGSDRSVRFNWERTSAADFARLDPLRPRSAPRAIDEEATRERLETLWRDAESAEWTENPALVRDRLNEYLSASTYSASTGFEGEQTQERRNSAIDRIDAISALDQGAPRTEVRRYLEARSLYEGDATIDVVEGQFPKDARLADNVAYLIAAISYREEYYQAAARQFEALAARYPRSEKREAALFMAARAHMRVGLAIVCCGYGSDSQLKPEERARVLAERSAARKGFLKLLAAYPKGRFAVEARGWLAHLEWHRGDRVAALAEYFRLIADPTDAAAVAHGLASLRVARQHATEAEMHRLEAMLEREPRAGLAYAYYELYNFGPWVESALWYNDDGESERPRQSREETFTRIVDFATRMAARTRGDAASAPYVVRAAMANLELGRDEPASTLARQALATGAKGEAREQALWVAGCADFHRGEHARAKRDFETLLAETAAGATFAEGARCHLAMIAEDGGDLGGALEHYVELDYDLDVGYFVDVLMTPDQLAEHLASHPKGKARDELWYALGVRYMRAGRLSEARAAYAKVRTIGGWQDELYARRWSPDSDFVAKAGMAVDPDVDGVRARWVVRDIQTVDDLEHLRARVDAAEGDEARAEALYQLASYLYEGSCLLFYNPGAWHGMRAGILDQSESTWLREPGEERALWEHARSHEPVAQALAIFLEIVDRYPNTRAARDALLTAKFCDDRLAGYNAYWSRVYGEGGHAGSRGVTGATLRATYPDYVWPQAGIGTWEPSTRTAAGLPAWPEPPKPQPPIPLWRRVTKRAFAILTPPAAWAYDLSTHALKTFLTGEAARARLVLLALCLIASGVAVWRTTRAASRISGRRATRAAVRATASLCRIRREEIVSLLHPKRRDGIVERVLARRTGLALLTYSLPASLLAALLLALASRM